LTRHLGMEEGPGLHLASSAMSGFVVCCFMHPPGKSIEIWGIPVGS
jgi:solute carrier family 25 protein 34/35